MPHSLDFSRRKALEDLLPEKTGICSVENPMLAAERPLVVQHTIYAREAFCLSHSEAWTC